MPGTIITRATGNGPSWAPSMTHDRSLWAAGLAGLVLVASAGTGRAADDQRQPPPPVRPPLGLAADGNPTVVIRSQHRRLPFVQDIQRIAVGDTEILSAELIPSREVLVLGRETGRTTLIVWFANGTSREYLFSVQRDLSLLERALKRVNPSIEVESAPDRDAIVLTGIVPNVVVSETAEAVARNYLDAGNRSRSGAQALVAAPPGPAGAAPAPPGAAAQPPPTTAPATSQLQGAVQPSAAVINLIQLETLPPLPEDKILGAIRTIGGQGVTIRRVLHGDVRDDS